MRCGVNYLIKYIGFLRITCGLCFRNKTDHPKIVKIETDNWCETLGRAGMRWSRSNERERDRNLTLFKELKNMGKKSGADKQLSKNKVAIHFPTTLPTNYTDHKLSSIEASQCYIWIKISFDGRNYD